MNLTVGLGNADNRYKVHWAVNFQWCTSGTDRSHPNYSLDDYSACSASVWTIPKWGSVWYCGRLDRGTGWKKSSDRKSVKSNKSSKYHIWARVTILSPTCWDQMSTGNLHGERHGGQQRVQQESAIMNGQLHVECCRNDSFLPFGTCEAACGAPCPLLGSSTPQLTQWSEWHKGRASREEVYSAPRREGQWQSFLGSSSIPPGGRYGDTDRLIPVGLVMEQDVRKYFRHSKGSQTLLCKGRRKK